MGEIITCFEAYRQHGEVAQHRFESEVEVVSWYHCLDVVSLYYYFCSHSEASWWL